MEYLLTAKEMKEADTYTSEVIGVPSAVLMERAALQVFSAILELRSTRPLRKVVVVSGLGGNGADGLAVARLCAEENIPVSCFRIEGTVRDGSLFALQEKALSGYQIPVLPWTEEALKTCVLEETFDTGVILLIDAIAGIGLSGALRDPVREGIRLINTAKQEGNALVYSVDLPSGLDTDTGKPLEEAVMADKTITFAFYKRAHFTEAGRPYCGEVVLRPVGISARSLTAAPEMFTYRSETAKDLLPLRDPSGNKGSNGKILIVGGSYGMAGALLLSGKSAYLSGSGMVKLCTDERNREILQESLPEALLSLYDEETPVQDGLRDACQWADVIVLGPGLSTSHTAYLLVEEILKNTEKPLVLDADALNLIAEHEELRLLLRERGKRSVCILTPHLMELSRLCKQPVAAIKEDPLSHAKKTAEEFSCTILAKSARSYVANAENDRVYLNTSGNSALATAGTGDVLAGLCGSLLSGIKGGFLTACAASYLHGRAGETASLEKGEMSVLAGDVADAIPEVLR
ncbi:MAG: NAD(P)H-hydrate dehydratase [Lachnospiraceae bacterium]|nr:NAD(P)H-hydrate dehydratase [Lachnospiraceae bacterium]